ncbi:hypothetical protein ACP4OV_010694 [Aristida adscensionis]
MLLWWLDNGLSDIGEGGYSNDENAGFDDILIDNANFEYYKKHVLYLDCLNFGSFKVSHEIPRISFWSSSLIKYFSKLDYVKTTKYGRRPFKVLSATSQQKVHFDGTFLDNIVQCKVAPKTDFKSHLDILYGSVLSDEGGISALYDSYCATEFKRSEENAKALICKTFSFYDELSSKYREIGSEEEPHQSSPIVLEDAAVEAKVVVLNPSSVPCDNHCVSSGIEEQILQRDEAVDVDLNPVLNLQNYDTEVAIGDHCHQVNNTNDPPSTDVEDNRNCTVDPSVLKYPKPVVDLSTPGFINEFNRVSLVCPPKESVHLMKQKINHKVRVVNNESSKLDPGNSMPVGPSGINSLNIDPAQSCLRFAKCVDSQNFVRTRSICNVNKPSPDSSVARSRICRNMDYVPDTLSPESYRKYCIGKARMIPRYPSTEDPAKCSSRSRGTSKESPILVSDSDEDVHSRNRKPHMPIAKNNVPKVNQGVKISGESNFHHKINAIGRASNCGNGTSELDPIVIPENRASKFSVTEADKRAYVGVVKLGRDLQFASKIACLCARLKKTNNFSYVEPCFERASSVLDLKKAHMLLFPICNNDHWFVFIVDLKNKNFTFLDSYFSENDDYHVQVRVILVPNFKKVWYNNVYKASDLEDFPYVYPPVPKQKNLVDCGFFVLKFLQFWTPNGSLCTTFSQADIGNIRIQTVSDLLFSEHNTEDISPVRHFLAEIGCPPVGNVKN